MFLHTFSVVARCRETGRFGAAVASYFPGWAPTLPMSGRVWERWWFGAGSTLLSDSTAWRCWSGELSQRGSPGKAALSGSGPGVAATGHRRSQRNDRRSHRGGESSCEGTSDGGGLCRHRELSCNGGRAFRHGRSLSEKRGSPGGTASRRPDRRGSARRGTGGGSSPPAVRVVALTGFPYVDFRVDHHPDRSLNSTAYTGKTRGCSLTATRNGSSPSGAESPFRI